MGGVIPPKSKARNYYFMPPFLPGGPVNASTTEPIHHMATPATISSERTKLNVKSTR